MRVVATGASKNSELVFLNSAEDRTSAENFTVVLDRKAQQGLKDKGIADVRRQFEARPIRVVGTLSLFREQPQIIVADARKIEIGGK